MLAALLAVAFVSLRSQALPPVTYRIRLADGTQSQATLTLPTTAEGAVVVESDDTRSLFRPYAVSGATASVVGKLSRWEALPVKGGWQLRRPLGGALPLDAPLISFHDLRLFLGKRIAERGSAPLRFWQLGYASARPGLDRVDLTEVGTTPLLVGTQKVVARRYRATIKLWLNGKTQQSILYLGPSGELLRADPPFVSTPLRAASLLSRGSDGTLAITYKEPGYTLQAQPTADGYTVKAVVAGRALPGSVTTDSQGRPLRLENDFPGKPFVGVWSPEAISWTLDAPQITRTVLPDPDDLALFPAQLFATSLWEKAFAQPGEQKNATLLLLHDGIPDEVTIERLDDPLPGIHRYRFRAETFQAELLTDGQRLRLLRRPDGTQIVAEDSKDLPMSVPPLVWP